MYEYEKTLLYLYPVADRLTEVYRDRANGKIRASYYCHDGAEEQILETISLMATECVIQDAKKDMESALKELSSVEQALLEIQYIRRKKKIQDIPFRRFPFSERSFYRKTHGAIKRFSSLLKKNGNDERWFKESFSACPEVMRVYGKVKNGRDLYYRRKIEGFGFSSTRKKSGKREE